MIVGGDSGDGCRGVRGHRADRGYDGDGIVDNGSTARKMSDKCNI